MTAPAPGSPSTVSVVGLGKIGAPLAACLAARGMQVVGVDVDTSKVAAVNAGRAPVEETGLADLVSRSRSSLRATTSLENAVLESEVTFVALPTEAATDGSLAVPALLPACREIGAVLRDKPGFHLLAVASTVMPGTTAAAAAAVAAASGKREGDGFGVCFAPEFVALGSAIRDFLEPDLVLIGAADARSGDLLQSVLKRLYENDPPIVRTTLAEAELAKLALNAFLATKISFANVLAEICERLPDCDVDEVTSAIGLDSRVGHRFLTGGLSFGGPCLPRDTAAFATLARGHEVPAQLAEAVLEVNAHVLDRLVRITLEELPPGGCVGIYGLAFKPGTGVAEASPGMALARTLSGAGTRVVGFDPVSQPAFDEPVELAGSLDELLAEADVLVIAAPSPEFPDLDEADGDRRPRAVIDCWRGVEPQRLAAEAYVALGRGRR